tara:strand:+ start:296 stop:655 length:360 start_codon:yes stop_codon:yes gene_type:complete
MKTQILSEEFRRMQKLAGIITENSKILNKNFSENEISSLASSLDTEFKFSPETLKGRFTDLGINFILSPDKTQLILNITPDSGYDDPQEFVDDIQSEIGFPEYNFNVEGSKVYIKKKKY